MANTDRIFIHGPNGLNQVLIGELEAHPRAKPEEVYEKIANNLDPFLDYFIYEISGWGTHLFKVPASNFSLSGKSLEDFKMTPLLGQGKLYKIVDQAGVVKIREIDVRVQMPGDRKELLPHEIILKEKIEVYLGENLMGKEPKREDLAKIISEMSYFLDMLAMHFELGFVKDKEADSYQMVLTLVGAPLELDIGEFPKELQAELQEHLQKKMEKIVVDHPFVKGADLVGVDFEETRYSFSKKPEASQHSSLLAWKYPKNLPVTNNDAWQMILAMHPEIPDPKLIPPALKGKIIPIPKSILREIEVWMEGRFKNREGIVDSRMEPAAKPGRWKLKFSERPYYEVRISKEEIQAVKAMADIDLSEEVDLLEKGTKGWSPQKMETFQSELRGKFRKAGFDLLVDHKEFFKSYDGKTMWMNLKDFSIPVLKKEAIQIEGEDFELPSIPQAQAIKDILLADQQDISPTEFDRRFQNVKKALVQADYLLATAYPDDLKSGFPMVKLEENRLRIKIAVARKGVLKINAPDIPDSSLAALMEGLRWQENEPYRHREFEQKLMRCLNRLQLKLEGDVGFMYRGSTALDVLLTIKKPEGEYQVGGGVDTQIGTPILQGVVMAPHIIPGTSSVRTQLRVGPYQQSLGVSATTLPISKGGTRLQAGIEGSNTFQEDSDYQSASVTAALMIPLGEGVSSPWHLLVPIRYRAIHRSSDSLSNRQDYGGSGIGISYADGGFIAARDFLQLSLTQDLDRNFFNGHIDTTSKASASYTYPLPAGGLQLEANVDVYHRQVLNNEYLDPIRLVERGSSPLDFSQEAARLPYDTNLTTSFLVKKPLGLITPFVGLSLSHVHEMTDLYSGTGSYHQRGALGVGMEIPFLGGMIYLGWPVMEDGAFYPPSAPVFGVQFGMRIPL